MTLRVNQAVGAAALIIFLFVVFHHTTEPRSLLPSFPVSRPTPKTPDLDLKARIAIADRAWNRSVAQRNHRVKSYGNPQVPMWPSRGEEWWADDFGQYPHQLWDFFPATWACPHDMQRVGRFGDGGKWVCGMSVYESVAEPKSWMNGIPVGGQEGVVIYAFGVNTDSSFEAEMLDRIPSARVWGHDFSVQGWGPQITKEHQKRAFFSKVGIGKTDTPRANPPLYSLQTLMEANNHTYIDIMKIDVEGSEFVSFDAIMDHFTQAWTGEGSAVLPIGQILIELHVWPQLGVDFKRFKSWWERLESMGMRPTWQEINLLRITLGGQSVPSAPPDCTEYSWVVGTDPRNMLLQ